MRRRSTTVLLNSGQAVTIRLSEDYTEITFWEGDRKLGGGFEFIPNEDDSRYLLARMFSPVKQQGLGTAAIRLFLANTGAIIWARAHDGQIMSDGSHLTDDGPIFIGKMQEIGLIEANEE